MGRREGKKGRNEERIWEWEGTETGKEKGEKEGRNKKK